jgi:hypothetical protein
VDVEVGGEGRDDGDQCRDAEDYLGAPAQAPGAGHGWRTAGAGAGSSPLAVTGWLTAAMPFSRSAGLAAWLLFLVHSYPCSFCRVPNVLSGQLAAVSRCRLPADVGHMVYSSVGGVESQNRFYVEQG